MGTTRAHQGGVKGTTSCMLSISFVCWFECPVAMYVQEEDEGETGAVLQYPGVRTAAHAVLGEVVQRSVGRMRGRAAGVLPASRAAGKVGLMRKTIRHE